MSVGHRADALAMMNDLVTVVIPTYNRPDFLSQALGSVLAQDYAPFQALVVDDASSYDVAALVQSFHDTRLSLHRQRRNLGYIANSRWALTAPSTRYVAILEDDCLWLPHHLSRAVAALERQQTASFYCCATEDFGAGKSGIQKPYWSRPETPELCDWRETGFGVWLLRGVPMSVSSVVVRRRALDGLFWGGRTWPSYQDYLWWGQLAIKAPFVYDPHLGVRYRWHDANVTHTFDKRNIRTMAQWRFTMRFLATQAYALGGLRDLAGETRDFPAAVLANLLVALAAPESPRGLSQQAHAIFRTRPDLALAPDCTTLYRLAARFGDWALTYADVIGRVGARWWPIPAL
jgi:glycosyltransferase involved in cell wall biosynthesis